MNINMTDLFSSLTIMWQGMLGIFVVMLIISLIVAFTTKISTKK